MPESSSSPVGDFHRWLTVERIRKMQRMRRETVIAAMLSGELPYEQRGRIRYARMSDVLIWEESRLSRPVLLSTRPIAPELADLALPASRARQITKWVAKPPVTAVWRRAIERNGAGRYPGELLPPFKQPRIILRARRA